MSPPLGDVKLFQRDNYWRINFAIVSLTILYVKIGFGLWIDYNGYSGSISADVFVCPVQPGLELHSAKINATVFWNGFFLKMWFESYNIMLPISWSVIKNKIIETWKQTNVRTWLRARSMTGVFSMKVIHERIFSDIKENKKRTIKDWTYLWTRANSEWFNDKNINI